MSTVIPVNRESLLKASGDIRARMGAQRESGTSLSIAYFIALSLCVQYAMGAGSLVQFLFLIRLTRSCKERWGRTHAIGPLGLHLELDAEVKGFPGLEFDLLFHGFEAFGVNGQVQIAEGHLGVQICLSFRGESFIFGDDLPIAA